uniref:Uncharacterized protein n=1 Tax=Opuntia streptacantha TaxID=393608 RepID=A0A7C9CKQ5_OPUST
MSRACGLARNVNNKPIANIISSKAIKSLIDLVAGNKLNVTSDVVLPAYIHHFLCVTHPSCHASFHHSFSKDEGERRQINGLFRGTHNHKCPIHFQQLQRQAKRVMG